MYEQSLAVFFLRGDATTLGCAALSPALPMTQRDDDMAPLFLAALPLVLRNSAAARALGAEPPWAPTFTSDDVAPGRYAVLSVALRDARDAATAARACARVAGVCTGARVIAAAEAPSLGADGTARLAARARAARRIAEAIAGLRLLPRPAAEVVLMLQQQTEPKGGSDRRDAEELETSR